MARHFAQGRPFDKSGGSLTEEKIDFNFMREIKSKLLGFFRRRPGELAEEDLMLDGERLLSAFEINYNQLLNGRIDDLSYPRYTTDEVNGVSSLIDGRGLVVVRATRQLRLDDGYRQFIDQAKAMAEERGSMLRSETSKASEEIMGQISFGNMYPMISLLFDGPFISLSDPRGEGKIQASTDSNLVVEEGTYGVVDHIEWDFWPWYFGVVWAGFGKDNPGRIAWIPSVSLQQDDKHELELMPETLPEGWWREFHQLPDRLSEHMETNEVESLMSLLALNIGWSLSSRMSSIRGGIRNVGGEPQKAVWRWLNWR